MKDSNVLYIEDWGPLSQELILHNRALPVTYEARDCFAVAADENDTIRRNAERTVAAMDRLANMDRMDVLPCDTEQG